jgi:hypothetical protein
MSRSLAVFLSSTAGDVDVDGVDLSLPGRGCQSLTVWSINKSAGRPGDTSFWAARPNAQCGDS